MSLKQECAFMPFLSNFPVTSATVVKDMTYADLTSHAFYTNTVQKQNKTKQQWCRDPPELRCCLFT